MAELDLIHGAISIMIKSIGEKFADIIGNLERAILEIDQMPNISEEERYSLKKPYRQDLDDYLTQLYKSHNKLVICIYSICETTIAELSKDYQIKIIREPNPNNKPLLCPHLNGEECNVRRYKNPNFYLGDYLYSLDKNYKLNSMDARIVNSEIRELRNYFTHAKIKSALASKIVDNLSNCGITQIVQVFGEIYIKSVETLYKILSHCYRMLQFAYQIAKTK